MRMTQFYGLTREAENFLNENCKMIKETTCPNCLHVLTMKRLSKQVGEVCGMDDFEKFALNQFELKDGRIVREEVQGIPWSSGPMIFFRLAEVSGEVDEKGNQISFFPPLYEWDPDEWEKM